MVAYAEDSGGCEANRFQQIPHETLLLAERGEGGRGLEETEEQRWGDSRFEDLLLDHLHKIVKDETVVLSFGLLGTAKRHAAEHFLALADVQTRGPRAHPCRVANCGPDWRG